MVSKKYLPGEISVPKIVRTQLRDAHQPFIALRTAPLPQRVHNSKDAKFRPKKGTQQRRNMRKTKLINLWRAQEFIDCTCRAAKTNSPQSGVEGRESEREKIHRERERSRGYVLIFCSLSLALGGGGLATIGHRRRDKRHANANKRQNIILTGHWD